MFRKPREAYPKLATKEETRALFICESCDAEAVGPWPTGWVESGRSLLRIPPHRGCHNAQWCPKCFAVIENMTTAEASSRYAENPSQGKIDAFRDYLKVADHAGQKG